ncbi:MAG: hypothetical protein DME54_13200 [Verrucomicrobia bacterium]|nr:MAG: hypothetical protein DME62_12635 [Verrucomicrobiota bacterium]PYK33261.1 MAG: hypothetical protein DME54_13200 [Verrucomicrobiota bacterium]
MNEQPFAALLKTLPYTRYYPEWRLLTWHPRGLFDDALADKIVGLIGSEERVEQVPFHRYADFSGLTHIRLKVGHVFDVAKQRSAVREAVKSAFFADTTVGFGIARMYEALMEEAIIQVRAFRERATAAEWLGVPLEILQSDPR